MTDRAPFPRRHHGTIVLGRTLEVPVARVYAALSDPLERARMGAAGDRHVLVVEESDFRIGGRDVYRFGPKGAPLLRAEVVYHQIVPGSLIVATEIVHAEDICVSVTLVTVDLREHHDDDTDVKLTAQLLALSDDEDLVDTSNGRHQDFIDNLARHLGVTGRDRGRPISRR